MNSLKLQHATTAEGQMGAWAPYYDLIMKLTTLGREKTLREATIALAPVEPGNSVLEVGCGTGTLALAAKEHVGQAAEVHGLDAAPEMIAIARRKSIRAGKDVTFRVGQINELPYPTNTFDVVLCSFMIFHMSAEVRRLGLQEILRVLKDDGRVLIVDSASSTHLDDLQHLMMNTGFTEITSGRIKLACVPFLRVSFVRGRVRRIDACDSRILSQKGAIRDQ